MDSCYTNQLLQILVNLTKGIFIFAFMMVLLREFRISVSLGKYHLMVLQLLLEQDNHDYREQKLNEVIFVSFD
jgi:hypothetical protein